MPSAANGYGFAGARAGWQPFETPAPFIPGEHRCKMAAEPWEISAYWRLRREVFCLEQGLFEQSDRDEHDLDALPIVAIADMMGMPNRVVGAVRIYPDGPGTWYGSRLAVQEDSRGVPGLGAGLIRKAVGTAHARGCHRFLATVQRQNVPFFRRLHWRTLKEITAYGRPHHLMEADLDFYPPCPDDVAIEIAPERRRRVKACDENPLSPSPSTLGEGWGECLRGARRCGEDPHPNPLPAYREREQEGAPTPGGDSARRAS